jgi:hypothetical protein
MSLNRERYQIRPIEDAVGLYLSNVNVFVRRARECLLKLETVAADVRTKWPGSLDQTVKDAKRQHPELEALSFERDFLCDLVLLSSAMSVEAFLNYYGVVRLGEAEFNRHFERLGITRKLRALLLFCDSIRLADDDPLLIAVDKIAKIRNALVHPKTKELTEYLPAEARGALLIPGAAQEAVAAMDSFFKEFEMALPKAKHLIPDGGGEESHLNI